MSETIVKGHSLEEIRQEWAVKLKLLPEEIKLEVIAKPGLFSRQWEVRLIWQEPNPKEQEQATLLTPSQVIWDETKYVIVLGEGVKQFIPFAQAGEVSFNGIRQDRPFRISSGEKVEFYPISKTGKLTWEIQVRLNGLSAVAKVRHERAGHYILLTDLPAMEEVDLAQCVTWERQSVQGEYWDEARLKKDLEQLEVIHGIRMGIWPEILAVEGVGEVVIAEATLAVPAEHARLEDFVGSPQVPCNPEEKFVDFFASKVRLVDTGAVLARKIPGKSGVPGKDVLGKVLPVSGFKDFQLRLKKNVYLSADGLEVLAACGGQPVRVDEKTYMVENVYVRQTDVDLATGSIDFPGDVFVNGNVQDGLHIFAGGKLEIKGSVSHAEIRAEKGAKIYQNLVGGKVIIGEKFVVRSELLRSLSELRDQLSVCLYKTAELIKAPGALNFKPGQCLKMVMEKQFPELSKLSSRVEKFVLDHKNDELVSESLIVSIRTAKHFLAGLGPLDPQALPYLQRVNELLEQFVESLTIEIPEKLSFVVSYVQGANIQCGGSFECQKGAYNSELRVEGDITIEGVCRGGKLFAGGKVRIGELGGSGASSTFVQISPDGGLSVKYCHSNIIIAVGKEIIQIEEDYRQLEIYREKGYVQVSKIRANPL